MKGKTQPAPELEDRERVDLIPAGAAEPPYRPSGIDRFNGWVQGLPVRAWVFYAVFGLVLVGVQVLALWLEGGLGETAILPVIVFDGLFTPFLLALMYLLDRQAAAALETIRPALELPEAEVDGYAYRLTTMPAAAPLAAGLAMLAIVILMEQLWIVPVRYADLEELPVFSFVFQITDKSSAFLFGVFFYHTIRQLRLVNAIHAGPLRIDLFNLGPLKAFSQLTASTAAGLVVGVYGWLLINPELLGDPVILAIAVGITVLAGSVFVWPLYGVHRRIEAAKEQALTELDLRLKKTFAEFNRRFDAEDAPALQALSGTISSLEIQHRRIRETPTWPWKPETAQFALTAIALPLIFAVLQFLVEQAMN